MQMCIICSTVDWQHLRYNIIQVHAVIGIRKTLLCYSVNNVLREINHGAHRVPNYAYYLAMGTNGNFQSPNCSEMCAVIACNAVI